MQTTDTLVGRSAELHAVDDLLERVDTRGAVLVVRGEPGIGKSAIINQAASRADARGLAVLKATGVPSEARVAFAGLHQLLQPIVGQLEQLPTRQRDALRIALGLSDDDGTPDFFLIALATLGLLSEAATSKPLLVLAEDAHWLDPSTLDVLSFVARRLDSEPVVMLISCRPDFDGPLNRAGFQELVLTRLDDATAAELLDAQGRGLAPSMRAHLLAHAEGNPLALVELPVALEQLAEASVPPLSLPLTRRLEETFAARSADLEPATRTLLIAAAVTDSDSLAEVLAAASIVAGVPLGVEDLGPAVAAKLVEVDGMSLRFRHPLVRSALDRSATPSQRQAAHAALAEVLVGDPDRRVWHHAAATAGKDEELAAALEAAATRARRFRGIAAAVAAFERAAELSDTPADRGGRLLLAAESAFEMGRRDIVARLMKEAEPLALGPLQRARFSWLRGLFDGAVSPTAVEVRAFVDIVDRIQLEGDTELALGSLLALALRAWWTRPDQETLGLIVSAADRLSAAPDDARLLAIEALAAPIERAESIIDRVSRIEADHLADPEAMRLLGVAVSTVGAVDRSVGFLAASAEGLRSQGRLGLLAQTLISLAWSEYFQGRWLMALSAAEESRRLAEETAQPGLEATGRVTQAVLSAARGDHQRASAMAKEVERLAIPIGASPLLAFGQLAHGLGALGDGRPAEALDQLTRIFDSSDPAFHPFVSQFALVELVEAAVGADRRDSVREIIEASEGIATRTPSPLLHASLGYARAILAPDDRAGSLFDTALLDPNVTRLPFLRARLLLAYGTWLRRRRRPAESRAPLRTARDAFDAFDARPWAERARQQLRASGEVSRRRGPEARDELTAQELQVAVMAADGLSNREIGERLYVSHRTVAAHLYRVFPKLGITARSQLASGLATQDAAGP